MSAKKIRIKRYFHVLLRQGKYDFIKTLDEGVSLPSHVFVDQFLQSLLVHNQEDILMETLVRNTGYSEAEVQEFIQSMFDAGVLEYFETPSPAYARYDRQLLFLDALQPARSFEAGYEKQDKLAAAHVAVIGMGGIGNYMALSLAACGIGKLSLIDNDLVDTSNLSRQILFSEADLGRPKAHAAVRRLQEQNPACQVVSYQESIHSKAALESLLQRIGPVDYLVLSADQAILLPNWASDLRKTYRFKAVKCGYMGYQGLIGPIFGPDTKDYEAMFQSWSDLIEGQPEHVQAINDQIAAPASSPSNAILANIACLEIIKDLSGTSPVMLMEKRLLFNLQTLEVKWG